MDDRSIAWMISGGLRAETRDQQIQRRHRMALAEAASPPRAAGSVADWRVRLGLLLDRRGPASTTMTPASCPA